MRSIVLRATVIALSTKKLKALQKRIKQYVVYVDVFVLASGNDLNSMNIYLWKMNLMRLAKSFYVGLELLFSNHSELEVFGHEGRPGIVVMKGTIRSKVWWPGMDNDVVREYRTCYGCQLVSIPGELELMNNTRLASAPWVHLFFLFWKLNTLLFFWNEWVFNFCLIRERV